MSRHSTLCGGEPPEKLLRLPLTHSFLLDCDALSGARVFTRRQAAASGYGGAPAYGGAATPPRPAYPTASPARTSPYSTAPPPLYAPSGSSPYAMTPNGSYPYPAYGGDAAPAEGAAPAGGLRSFPVNVAPWYVCKADPRRTSIFKHPITSFTMFLTGLCFWSQPQGRQRPLQQRRHADVRHGPVAAASGPVLSEQGRFWGQKHCPAAGRPQQHHVWLKTAGLRAAATCVREAQQGDTAASASISLQPTPTSSTLVMRCGRSTLLHCFLGEAGSRQPISGLRMGRGLPVSAAAVGWFIFRSQVPVCGACVGECTQGASAPYYCPLHAPLSRLRLSALDREALLPADSPPVLSTSRAVGSGAYPEPEPVLRVTVQDIS